MPGSLAPSRPISSKVRRSETWTRWPRPAAHGARRGPKVTAQLPRRDMSVTACRQHLWSHCGRAGKLPRTTGELPVRLGGAGLAGLAPLCAWLAKQEQSPRPHVIADDGYTALCAQNMWGREGG